MPLGYFLDSQEPSQAGLNLVLFLIALHLEHGEFRAVLSSRIKDSPSSKKTFLDALENIWGIPNHECFLLCYLTVAQVTNPRVGSCSCEIIPEGRSVFVYFDSSSSLPFPLHSPHHPLPFPLSLTTLPPPHTELSLNLFLFSYLSSYLFFPTHLSYTFVCV